MDYKGDYLDAAICALQAAEVLNEKLWIPKNLDTLRAGSL